MADQPKQPSIAEEFAAAKAAGQAARDAAAAARNAAQQQQSQVPGVPGAPPPTAAPGGGIAALGFPGAETIGKFIEGNADAGQSFLNRVTFGGLPALEKKVQDAVGFKGPSPQEQAAAAEQRSPLMTTAGAVGADAAHYLATRGILGGAGAPAAAARFGGGFLPSVITDEANRILGNPAPSRTESLVKGAVQGALPAAAPLVSRAAQVAAPFVQSATLFNPLSRLTSMAMRHLTPGVAETLSVAAPALESETRRTGSKEREDDARRNARGRR